MNFPFFHKKRNWANLDAFQGRETSSGIHITEAVALGIMLMLVALAVTILANAAGRLARGA